MRLMTVFAALLFVNLFTVSAQAGPAENFEGSYKLTRSGYGMCPTVTSILVYGGTGDYDSVTIVNWMFNRIDSGRREIDNDFEKGYVEAYSKGSNQLVRHRVAYDKIKHATQVEHTVATLSGKNLRVRHRGSGVFETQYDCSFVRTGDGTSLPSDNDSN